MELVNAFRMDARLSAAIESRILPSILRRQWSCRSRLAAGASYFRRTQCRRRSRSSQATEDRRNLWALSRNRLQCSRSSPSTFLCLTNNSREINACSTRSLKNTAISTFGVWVILRSFCTGRNFLKPKKYKTAYSPAVRRTH